MDSPPQLVLEGAGTSYPVGANALSIGSADDNQVVVSDGLVSLHHCVLWRTESSCYVRDDGSSNGTFLNDRRVTGAAEVREGDLLRIGTQVFAIRAARGLNGLASSSAIPTGTAPRVGTGGAFVALLATAAGLMILLVVGIGVLGRAAAPVSPPTASRVLPPTVAAASSPLALQDPRPVLMATVRVVVPIDGKPDSIAGSGAVISSEGYILTNFHVVGTPETGKLYNSAGHILIALNTPNLDQAPEISYLAELVKGEPDLDMALLKIVSRPNGTGLPLGYSLPWIAVGDSDALRIGDDLAVVGFPGLGDESVTLTKGTVSGFLDDGGLERAWIKTDTEISSGNSGGPAVNVRGELVGIASRIRFGPDSGKIGHVRPVNLAKSLLALVVP